MELSNRHRDTIEKIFDRPSSGNVEWRELLSLLEAVGDVVEEPNGRYRVTLGGEDRGGRPAARQGRRRPAAGRSETDAAKGRIRAA
jgi:hypothetical protein